MPPSRRIVFCQVGARYHLATAPAELAVDVAALARQLSQDPRAWLPEAVPAVLDYLPERTPLALYGRGPSWLYAAVAAHAWPADFFLFDVRLGWVAAPHLPWGDAGPWLDIDSHRSEDCTRLKLRLPEAYLDLADAESLALPAVDTPGLVLSGKLPHWLWASLARRYADREWVAIAQPQLVGAVVVRSRAPGLAVGTLVPCLDGFA